MIDDQTRQAILAMYEKDRPIKEISRLLKVSRNTARKVIKKAGAFSSAKTSGYEHHLPLIESVFWCCQGNAVRVREILAEEHQLDIPYATLTWLIRHHGLRKPKSKRAGQYHYVPGQELQHDTSPHRLIMGENKITAQCASLKLAHSRLVFIQYYPCFTRFEARIFLNQGFVFMDGTCPRCTVDNTSVIVAKGSGPEAIISPEMESFGRIFGVSFVAHRIGDPNRKAPCERDFYYAEKNFLAGRTFRDWDDLNAQAVRWCREVANKKPKRSLGMSPQEAYVMEKPSLIPLPPYIPPVYQTEYRVVDIEGYVRLDSNRYSVPEELIGQKVEVHKYLDQVMVYAHHKKVACHGRVMEKREARVTDPGHHRPLSRKKAHQGRSREEKLLSGQSEILNAYVTELKKRSHGRGLVRLRRLLALKQSYPQESFLAGIKQALTYGLFDLSRLEKIILAHIAGDIFNLK